ncbi:MAG: hypothetical protein ACLFNV_07880 [Desulfovibrionales bacterium]
MSRHKLENITTKATVTWCRKQIFDHLRTKGKVLSPRDSLNLRLASPKNSAVLRLPESLGIALCRPQIDFDIIAEDNGRARWLIPDGIHVLGPGKRVWTSHDYDGLRRQFLWPLFVRESPPKGLQRISRDLFRITAGVFEGGVPKEHCRTFGGLHMDVRRLVGGGIETSLRHLRAQGSALYLPGEIGLELSGSQYGHVVLVFGKTTCIGISLLIQDI